jgi:hypothetical protein
MTDALTIPRLPALCLAVYRYAMVFLGSCGAFTRVRKHDDFHSSSHGHVDVGLVCGEPQGGGARDPLGWASHALRSHLQSLG